MNSLIESNLLIFNETRLSEVLFTVFLLLRLIVGDISSVTSLVIAVVTLDYIIILNLLHHLDLVNTSLAVRARGGSGDISEAGGGIRGSLTLGSGGQILGRSPGGVVSMMAMIITMSMMITIMTAIDGVKGEGVHQRLAISGGGRYSAELASAKRTRGTQQCNNDKLKR